MSTAGAKGRTNFPARTLSVVTGHSTASNNAGGGTAKRSFMFYVDHVSDLLNVTIARSEVPYMHSDAGDN